MKNKLSVDEMITARNRIAREIEFQKGIIQYSDNDAADAAIARMPGLLKELRDLTAEINEQKMDLLDYALAIVKWW